jgi:KUP system potassium uptake protein
MSRHHHKLSAAGILITFGIIFGDIGTSPLYVMSAIIGNEPIAKDLIYGGISCIFWTLTFQTTFKYIILVLNADNNGEGGIFAMYSQVKRLGKWLIVPAMIGGCMLLAEGIITPAISVSSAIEGLRIINPDIPTIPIIIAILVFIFMFQRFGTGVVGSYFGPVMLIWFSMLGTLGVLQIIQHPEVLSAINPYYAYELLVLHPGGFWLLGAVFLCTTGAEALYSDLGHCGKENIRVSWIFVKICLLLNYFGQGASLIPHHGEMLTANPFFGIMSDWFLPIGIGIATLATIIASQALISGSFTLVSEAIRLNILPKLTVKYPSNIKGQLYIPFVNTMLMIGCIFVVLFFKEAKNMEAAYGLSVNITFLMTTTLLIQYLRLKRFPLLFIVLFTVVYLTIEGAFLFANLLKFTHGGYVTIIIASAYATLMIIWLNASKIKRRLAQYVKVKDYFDQLFALSHDTRFHKTATHLIYLSTASKDDEVEYNVLYSILQMQPKRADLYWFVHIEVTEEPFTMEYKVTTLVKDDIYKVRIRLGFRVNQRVNQFMKQIIVDMLKSGEVHFESPYHSETGTLHLGDMKYMILEDELSTENELPFWEQFFMSAYITIKQFTGSNVKWFGLDNNRVSIDKIPLVIRPASDINLKRV